MWVYAETGNGSNQSKGKHMKEDHIPPGTWLGVPETHNYTLYALPKPVGHWVLYPHSTPTVSFSMYHKPTRSQIWFTERLLGWQWRDA